LSSENGFFLQRAISCLGFKVPGTCLLKPQAPGKGNFAWCHALFQHCAGAWHLTLKGKGLRRDTPRFSQFLGFFFLDFQPLDQVFGRCYQSS